MKDILGKFELTLTLKQAREVRKRFMDITGGKGGCAIAFEPRADRPGLKVNVISLPFAKKIMRLIRKARK